MYKRQVYVLSGKQIYKDMTKFWGKLFGINFALGVATGLTMEFQFGTNWSYYSHYVGDIFGAPLAIEGLMAFFLESTFVGLFFFGWDRLGKVQHMCCLLYTSILVPDLPESVADATVATWHKKPGDAVVRDEVLVEIETDKVVLEVPASADGILDAVLEDEGTTVTSRQILGRLREGNSAGKETSAKSEEKASTPAQRLSLIHISLSAWNWIT